MSTSLNVEKIKERNGFAFNIPAIINAISVGQMLS
jgi:hypothetical protein